MPYWNRFITVSLCLAIIASSLPNSSVAQVDQRTETPFAASFTHSLGLQALTPFMNWFHQGIFPDWRTKRQAPSGTVLPLLFWQNIVIGSLAATALGLWLLLWDLAGAMSYPQADFWFEFIWHSKPLPSFLKSLAFGVPLTIALHEGAHALTLRFHTKKWPTLVTRDLFNRLMVGWHTMDDFPRGALWAGMLSGALGLWGVLVAFMFTSMTFPIFLGLALPFITINLAAVFAGDGEQLKYWWSPITVKTEIGQHQLAQLATVDLERLVTGLIVNADRLAEWIRAPDLLLQRFSKFPLIEALAVTVKALAHAPQPQNFGPNLSVAIHFDYARNTLRIDLPRGIQETFFSDNLRNLRMPSLEPRWQHIFNSRTLAGVSGYYSPQQGRRSRTADLWLILLTVFIVCEFAFAVGYEIGVWREQMIRLLSKHLIHGLPLAMFAFGMLVNTRDHHDLPPPVLNLWKNWNNPLEQTPPGILIGPFKIAGGFAEKLRTLGNPSRRTEITEDQIKLLNDWMNEFFIVVWQRTRFILHDVPGAFRPFWSMTMNAFQHVVNVGGEAMVFGIFHQGLLSLYVADTGEQGVDLPAVIKHRRYAETTQLGQCLDLLLGRTTRPGIIMERRWRWYSNGQLYDARSQNFRNTETAKTGSLWVIDLPIGFTAWELAIKRLSIETFPVLVSVQRLLLSLLQSNSIDAVQRIIGHSTNLLIADPFSDEQSNPRRLEDLRRELENAGLAAQFQGLSPLRLGLDRGYSFFWPSLSNNSFSGVLGTLHFWLSMEDAIWPHIRRVLIKGGLYLQEVPVDDETLFESKATGHGFTPERIGQDETPEGVILQYVLHAA